MINNFIGIIGSNGREVINVMEEILINSAGLEMKNRSL